MVNINEIPAETKETTSSVGEPNIYQGGGGFNHRLPPPLPQIKYFLSATEKEYKYKYRQANKQLHSDSIEEMNSRRAGATKDSQQEIAGLSLSPL